MDLCRECTWADITPGEDITCRLHWPGIINDNECVACKSHQWCLPTTNLTTRVPITASMLANMAKGGAKGYHILVIPDDAMDYMVAQAQEAMELRGKETPTSDEWETVAECEQAITDAILEFIPWKLTG